MKIGQIRNSDAAPFANRLSSKFYESLNEPFKAWLAHLTNHDDREREIELWKETLRKLVWMLQAKLSKQVHLEISVAW